MPLPLLVTTHTFRDWFESHNDIIGVLNSTALVDGVVSNGAFTVNGSLLVVNTFSANTTAVWARGNTTFSANVAVTANCNVWNFICGTLLLQPTNGTFVNTAITVNAFATFLRATTFGANVSITAAQSDLTGNLLLTGTTTANGTLLAQHIAYAAPGALVAPANLTNPQYNDYQPTGGDVAQIWNLTPAIDTVLTGLAAPTGFVTGSRVLYIQNLSATYKISFASANTDSQTANRFKTPLDAIIDIIPGGIAELVWSTTNQQWRVISSDSTTFLTMNVSGNAVVSGTLNVAGNTTFSGSWVNVVGKLQVTGNSQLGNTNVTGWLNVSSTLTVAGLSTLTGNATLSGFANIAGKLVVAGLSTLTGNATLSGFANIAGALVVAGLSTLTGNATLSGFANIAGALVVAGLSTLTGNATLSGFANVVTTLQVAGNTTLNGSRTFANGQLRCDTTNGRFVLPVGTNMWAT